MLKRLRTFIRNIFEMDRYVEAHKADSLFHGKLNIQIIVSVAFFTLSLANIFSHSYIMLYFTAGGGVINFVLAMVARRYRNTRMCAVSTVITCSLLFGFFVIYGGNDGFACLWVILMPLLSMVAMDFVVGLWNSIFFQVFLVVVFWTPVRDMLPYRYNDQFCLRFPLFFFVTFILGLTLTISLRRSEYNECRHQLELEELAASARSLARLDPLTKLANRRSAYEEFEDRFIAEGRPHCIIMGDVDNFKKVNDTYSHEFGDSVLVTFAQYMTTLLPEDYLKCRWGGEEFLFAANAPVETVYAQVEHLRKTLAAHEFICGGETIHITVTFGIAPYGSKGELGSAISLADDRLYRGKTSTKNCTVADDEGA